MTSTAADPFLTDVTRVIVDGFAPERIILFGSRARGDHHVDSDYDLLVVLDSPSQPDERTASVRAALGDRARRIDVITYSADEFERHREDVGALAYAGETEGRILYDRIPGRWQRRVPGQQPGGRAKRPNSVADWLARSKSDFNMMDLGMRQDRIDTDAVSFHAHQGVEKLLKAVLIVYGVRPPRTHVLADLLNACPMALQLYPDEKSV